MRLCSNEIERSIRLVFSVLLIRSHFFHVFTKRVEAEEIVRLIYGFVELFFPPVEVHFCLHIRYEWFPSNHATQPSICHGIKLFTMDDSLLAGFFPILCKLYFAMGVSVCNACNGNGNHIHPYCIWKKNLLPVFWCVCECDELSLLHFNFGFSRSRFLSILYGAFHFVGSFVRALFAGVGEE